MQSCKAAGVLLGLKFAVCFGKRFVSLDLQSCYKNVYFWFCGLFIGLFDVYLLSSFMIGIIISSSEMPPCWKVFL